MIASNQCLRATPHSPQISTAPIDFPVDLECLDVSHQFQQFVQGLAGVRVVDSHRSLNGSLLLAFDGTEYFSSLTIHCDQCSKRQHANGTVTYFHTAVTPVLVKPGCDKVIPLTPEFVTPQDGTERKGLLLGVAEAIRACCAQKSAVWL